MDTGKQSGQAVPRSSGVDARPVVLVLVEDTIGSLASLLLAADIAAVQQGRLHVAHISSPRLWWGGLAGVPAGSRLIADLGTQRKRASATSASSAPGHKAWMPRSCRSYAPANNPSTHARSALLRQLVAGGLFRDASFHVHGRGIHIV